MKKELTVYVNFLPSITKTVDRNFNEDPRNSYLRFELSLSPCSAPSNCRVRFSVSPARSPHFVRRPSRRPSSRATVETILKKQQQQQQQKQTRKAKWKKKRNQKKTPTELRARSGSHRGNIAGLWTARRERDTTIVSDKASDATCKPASRWRVSKARARQAAAGQTPFGCRRPCSENSVFLAVLLGPRSAVPVGGSVSLFSSLTLRAAPLQGNPQNFNGTMRRQQSHPYRKDVRKIKLKKK